MFRDFFDPAVATFTATFMTIFFGIITLYFKWLIGSFERLEKAIKDLSTTTSKWLSDHESLDQRRHEQNLSRFETLSVSLAKLDHD